MTQTATIKVKADMPKNLTAPKVSSPVTPKPVAPKAPPATPVNVCNAPSAVNSNVCLAVSTNA